MRFGAPLATQECQNCARDDFSMEHKRMAKKTKPAKKPKKLRAPKKLEKKTTLTVELLAPRLPIS
jgi:hypothetical protein